MRVRVTSWRGTHETDLEDALRPQPVLEDSGIAERANDRASLALEVLGALLAQLVRRGVLDLNTAAQIAQQHDQIEVTL